MAGARVDNEKLVPSFALLHDHLVVAHLTHLHTDTDTDTYGHARTHAHTHKNYIKMLRETLRGIVILLPS